jgi:hypothetical protein
MTPEKLDLINQLHAHGIFKQDIMGVMNNLRPCMRFGMPKTDFNTEKTLSKLGLKMISIFNSELNNNICFAGKDLKYLKKAAGSELGTGRELGQFLGYPPCCIDAWEKYTINNPKNIAMPILSALNTKSKYSYELNYLYTLTSRGKKIVRVIEELNKKLPEHNPFQYNEKYLIPHMACSYDCRRSKLYADKLKKLLLRELPDYLNDLVYHLKRPTLFIYEYDFLIF